MEKHGEMPGTERGVAVMKIQTLLVAFFSVLMSCLPLPAGAAGGTDSLPPAAASSQVLATEWRPRIDALVRPLIETERSAGIVVGVYHQGRRFFAGYGKTDLEGGRLPDEKTIFEIGSLTKVFTTLALARAVTDQGLRLATPVKDLLPPAAKVPRFGTREITLLDLATHYSGLPRIPENFRPADPMDPYQDYTRRELYAFLAGYRLPRTPGAAYEYSNLGAGLLGHALSLKSGKSYEQLILTGICRPLGLTDTSFVVPHRDLPRFAPGYGPDLNRVPHWQFDVLAPAGALRSTAADLLKFAVANMKASGAWGRAMTQTQTPRFPTSMPEMRTGLGWLVIPKGQYNIVWHNGGTYGFSSFLAFSREKGTAVVVLRNTASYMNGHTDRLGVDIMKCLLGLPGEPISLEKEILVAGENLDAYVGMFAEEKRPNGPQAPGELRISRQGNRLAMTVGSDEEIILYPAAPAEFFSKGAPLKARFVRESGKGIVMVILSGAEEEKWVKKTGGEQPPAP